MEHLLMKNDALVTELSVTLISDYTITDHYDGNRNAKYFRAKPKFNSTFAPDIPELGIDNGCKPKGKKLAIFSYTIGDELKRNYRKLFRVSHCL